MTRKETKLISILEEYGTETFETLSSSGVELAKLTIGDFGIEEEDIDEVIEDINLVFDADLKPLNFDEDSFIFDIIESI